VVFGAGDLNHRGPALLHGADLSQQISMGIQAQEGTHDPPDVRCPPTEPVRNGWQFVCTRMKGGRAVPVQVVEVDGRGRLRWSLSTQAS
jgi:hypothetical protein